MLFLEIRRNRKLAARRSPMFEKNRFAKVFMYCGIAFWAAYLLFIGVMLPFAFQESFPGMEPYHILNQGLVIILAIDFLIRFMLPSYKKSSHISCCLFPKGKSYSLFFWINFGIRLISSGYSCLSLSP